MPRIFITIILIFGSIVLGAFYLRPQWQEFANLRIETEDLASVSSELDELIANRDTLIQTINSVSKDDLTRVNSALPQGVKSAEFLIMLEALANRNRVTLKQIDISSASVNKSGQPRPGGAIAAPAKGTIQEFPISLSVSGSYEAFKEFLRDLESNLRLVDILEITFNSSGRAGNLDFSLRGKTYYQ